MAYEQDSTAGTPPFSVVWKGFDREEVSAWFERYDAELRVITADRDAAAAQSRDLASSLDAARAEIERLRDEVKGLSQAPTTAQGMSERISRMLQIATDEAAETRSRAQADAAEMRSVAEQEATALRSEQERVLVELQDRRSSLNAEHERTLAKARTEAARLVQAAQAEEARLDAESAEVRHRAEEATRQATAKQRADAQAAADRLEAQSRREAEERIAAAKAKAEEVRQLRSRMLAQLSGLRSQLDEVPALLAAVHREGELLDGKAPAEQPAAEKPAATPSTNGSGPASPRATGNAVSQAAPAR